MWNIMYLNCEEREHYEDIIDHHRYSQLRICEINLEEMSGLNGIWTYDPYNTSAVVYQLSYQSNWGSVAFFSKFPKTFAPRKP